MGSGRQPTNGLTSLEVRLGHFEVVPPTPALPRDDILGCPDRVAPTGTLKWLRVSASQVGPHFCVPSEAKCSRLTEIAAGSPIGEWRARSSSGTYTTLPGVFCPPATSSTCRYLRPKEHVSPEVSSLRRGGRKRLLLLLFCT